MLDEFMGSCSPYAAYLPLSSLNIETEDSDGQPVEIIDLVPDPRSEQFGLGAVESAATVKLFVETLTPRLADIAHNVYWLGKSKTEIAFSLKITPSAVSHALRKIHTLGRKFFGVSTN